MNVFPTPQDELAPTQQRAAAELGFDEDHWPWYVVQHIMALVKKQIIWRNYLTWAHLRYEASKP